MPSAADGSLTELLGTGLPERNDQRLKLRHGSASASLALASLEARTETVSFASDALVEQIWQQDFGDHDHQRNEIASALAAVAGLDSAVGLTPDGRPLVSLSGSQEAVEQGRNLLADDIAVAEVSVS